MSSTTKQILMVCACVLAGYFVLKMVVGALLGATAWLLGMIFPVLVVGGILYVLYLTVGRKALGGGGRRTLP